MSTPEDNIQDEHQPTKEEWETYELRQRAEAAEARVKELEHDAYAVGYNAGVARMEDKLATVTAERDALAKQLAEGKA